MGTAHQWHGRHPVRSNQYLGPGLSWESGLAPTPLQSLIAARRASGQKADPRPLLRTQLPGSPHANFNVHAQTEDFHDRASLSAVLSPHDLQLHDSIAPLLPYHPLSTAAMKRAVGYAALSCALGLAESKALKWSDEGGPAWHPAQETLAYMPSLGVAGVEAPTPTPPPHPEETRERLEARDTAKNTCGYVSGIQCGLDR